ncbi:hypothetical protein GF327_07935 [Candidatus Woesearchaeota archaeon]|nr:hypothetical protein [Candidatus Woesearchaeota archaeon]
MIDEFNKIKELFEEINNVIDKKIKVYVIGGAALLCRDIKSATKDIDLVVKSKSEFIRLQKSLEKLNFKPALPDKTYSRMNLNQIFERKDFRIDLFEKEVCEKFFLSEKMIKRAEKITEYNFIKLFICSNEDIFLFKTMTEREGDLEDCINIATTQTISWKIILNELKYQAKKSKKDVWITWVGERFDILIEKGLDIPIMDEINKLRKDYYNKLENYLNK